MTELPADPAAVRELIAELEAEKAQNRLADYRPYPKQLEFHSAGATYRERLMIAANQSGKTLAGAMEVAMHATGKYPDWWKGRRFSGPTAGWACGETNEMVRDAAQRLLAGRPGALGTGTVPKSDILETVSARGTPDLMDSIKVRHVSGGVSIIGIKSYQRGREAFQGESLDFCWMDEEPGADVYSEILTRTNVGGGPVFITFTPLKGMSEVVRRFLVEKSPDRVFIAMTLDDVNHYTLEEKQRIAASYAPHEREARTKGIPTLGSGRIFPVTEESLTIEHRTFPEHWPRIGGMDFGFAHAFAAVELVWDRDTDTVYVRRCHRIKEATVPVIASTLRAWGADLRWAYPKDGNKETIEGAGIALAEQFRAQGLNILPEYSHYLVGDNQKSVSVEAGLQDMLTRMESGRFKVFRWHNDWFDEFRLYHRKDGKVHKEHDDLMDAPRYAIMMLRHAATAREHATFHGKLDYSKWDKCLV
jgi:phage terminase large subunit-like protein